MDNTHPLPQLENYRYPHASVTRPSQFIIPCTNWWWTSTTETCLLLERWTSCRGVAMRASWPSWFKIWVHLSTSYVPFV